MWTSHFCLQLSADFEVHNDNFLELLNGSIKVMGHEMKIRVHFVAVCFKLINNGHWESMYLY